MGKYFAAIIKALNVIHYENMIIIATLTDKEMDDEYIKKIDDAFADSIKSIMQQD